MGERAGKRGNPTSPPGGGEGTRTLGLYIANVALYQLSYTPGGDNRILGRPGTFESAARQMEA